MDSPEEIQKQQEDTDRVKEFLQEEDTGTVPVTVISQKKLRLRQSQKTDKERHRDTVDGQDGSQKEEHTEESL